MKRALVSTMALGVAATLIPSTTQAQERGESQLERFAAELRFGPYSPKVDSDVAGSPYREVFGDDQRFFLGLEVDWQPVRIPGVGTLGPGLGWSFTKSSAKAALANGTGLSGQDTSLTIMPFHLALVARFDVIARRTPVPLVPYAKAGLGYALWWVGDGTGVAEAEGVRGEDTSFGFVYAAGLMLALNVFDPESAAHMKSSSEIQSAYIFGEWFSSQLDGFGSGDQMDVGTDSWVVGVAAEF